jgi:nucleotide-binding universal stress UspA family protein
LHVTIVRIAPQRKRALSWINAIDARQAEWCAWLTGGRPLHISQLGGLSQFATRGLIMIKDILAALAIRDETDPARDYALDMARHYRAHLTAVAYALSPDAPFSIYPGFVSGLAQKVRAEAEQAVLAARERFEAVARSSGVEHSFEQASCSVAEAASNFVYRLRTADIAVMTQHERHDPARFGDVFLDAALFRSGRPVLIVPRGYAGGFSVERVLIAWDASIHATRAVAAAVPFLVAGANVAVITVQEASKAEDFRGSALVEHLRRHGLDAVLTESRERDIPEAILRHAESSRATLLVMGGYGHARFRDFVFGSATRVILDQAPLPVLMAH